MMVFLSYHVWNAWVSRQILCAQLESHLPRKLCVQMLLPTSVFVSCLQDLKKQVVESGEDLAELEVSVSRLREQVTTQRATEAAAAEERGRRLEAARVAGLVPPVSGDKAGPLVQPSEA